MAADYTCEGFTTEELMTVFPGCACDFDQLPSGITLEAIIDQASDIIYLLTDGQVAGRCATTVRPCRPSDMACGLRLPFQMLIDGYTEEDGIPLPGPNPAVTQIKINGATVPTDDYKVLDGYNLVRCSGFWPSYQNLCLADTEEGTFSITFTTGSLPFLAQMAATEVACWLARWAVGKVTALPPGVSSVFMDGASVSVDRGAVDAEQTPWVSQLIGVYGGKESGAVWSPEIDSGWVLHTVG